MRIAGVVGLASLFAACASAPGETTGSTSQAVTSGSSSSSSPSSSTTTPSTTTPSSTTSDPAKKDPPGQGDLPGVGNQRKADGSQPGTVGKGLTKDDPKKPEERKPDPKVDNKKK